MLLAAIDSSIIRRLASAAARGYQQQSLVNELLAGPVRYQQNHWTITYGRTELQYSSYKNLRNRLVELGFVFKATGDRDYTNPYNGKLMKDWKSGVVVMTFPEASL